MRRKRGRQGRRGGIISFLVEALSSLLKRERLIPASLLIVLLTSTNIVILQNIPVDDASISPRFVMAAALRVIGLMVIAVAILRVAADSARPPWRPDWAFWLYQLVAPIGLLLAVLVQILLGKSDDVVSLLLGSLANALVMAPFAAWFAAIAVERPLAWNPMLWMRRFGCWLLPLVLWSMVLVVPMTALHAWIDVSLVRGLDGWFWPASLFDGPLSAAIAMIGLSLSVAAYRRVARG